MHTGVCVYTAKPGWFDIVQVQDRFVAFINLLFHFFAFSHNCGLETAGLTECLVPVTQLALYRYTHMQKLTDQIVVLQPRFAPCSYVAQLLPFRNRRPGGPSQAL